VDAVAHILNCREAWRPDCNPQAHRINPR
jgi:hypothetical protein